MSKDSGGDTQTVVQSTELPSWVDTAARGLVGKAADLADQDYQRYGGQRIAGNNSDLRAARDMVRDLGSGGSDIIGTGADAISGALDSNVRSAGGGYIGAKNIPTGGFDPSKVGAQSILSRDVNSYMDPYTDIVEKNAMRNINEQLQKSLISEGDSAAAAGAFGGTRHGVQEGVAKAEAAKAAGDVSAQLRSNAFNNAQSMMVGDANRAQTAQQANQSAGLQADSMRLDALKSNQASDLQSDALRLDAQKANQDADLEARQQGISGGIGLGTLGQTYTNTAAQEAALREGVGLARQGEEQGRLDLRYANWQDRQQEPYRDLALMQSTFGGVPYGSTSSTVSPVQGGSTALSTLGGASAGAGIASALGMSGATGLGITGAGALLGLLSEDDMKTDIEKLGQDPETGYDVYAYRYKDDPKSYPKVVGPMASDVAKKTPGRVRRIGGKRVIKKVA